MPQSELTPQDFEISTLGDPRHPNPICVPDAQGICTDRHVDESTRVRYSIEAGADAHADCSFEKAGVRERLFFKPEDVHAAVVTCGGLSPGLNDVIRAVVHTLSYRYGVTRISGIRYGYQGLDRKSVV